MGVVSSMSVSLIDRGRLWGLIACHHYAGPHRPSYTDRIAAEFLGRTASLLLHTKVAAGEQSGVVEVAQRAAQLAARGRPHPAGAGGGADRGRRHRAGPAARRGRRGAAQRPAAPARDDAAGRPGRCRWCASLLAAGVAGHRRRLAGSCPRRPTSPTPPAACSPSRCPAAATTSSPGSGPETLREVNWGGNPHTSKIGADRRRAAAEPAAVVRRPGARRCGGRRSRGASTRSPPPARSPATLAAGRAEPGAGGQPAGDGAAAHPAARGAAEGARRRRWPRGTCRAPRTSSAATGTTSSRCPAAGCRSCSGTSPATGCPPRRSPPSCGTRCARTCCARRARRPRSTGLNEVIATLLPGEMATAVDRRAGPGDRRGRRRQRRAPAGAARDGRRARSS